MNAEDLSKILEMLEPGMSVSVTQKWVDRIVPGGDLDRDVRTMSLAVANQCNWKRDGSTIVYTKHEI
jgi:hypothetical protein